MKVCAPTHTHVLCNVNPRLPLEVFFVVVVIFRGSVWSQGHRKEVRMGRGVGRRTQVGEDYSTPSR